MEPKAQSLLTHAIGMNNPPVLTSEPFNVHKNSSLFDIFQDAMAGKIFCAETMNFLKDANQGQGLLKHMNNMGPIVRDNLDDATFAFQAADRISLAQIMVNRLFAMLGAAYISE